MNIKLIKLKDAVELTGMSKAWFYQQVETNLIPCLRFGKAIRFNEQELLDWIRSGKFQEAKKERLSVSSEKK